LPTERALFELYVDLAPEKVEVVGREPDPYGIGVV
jgi:hypothetical protein